MRKFGWGFLTFLCGSMVIAGISATITEGGANNFLVTVLFVFLTWLCIRKFSGFGSIPHLESRKYNIGDPLPVTVCVGLLLERGEVGHLCEKVKIGKVKNVSTGSVTTRSGGSVRVARGLSVHSGTSRSKTIRADVLDTSPGTLYVTNKRLVGSSPKYSFNEKISALTSVKMYSDGFALQFGSKNYTVLCQEPIYVATILQIANRLSV